MFEQLSLMSFFTPAPLSAQKDTFRAEDIIPIRYESYVLSNTELSGGDTWDYKTQRNDREKKTYQIYASVALLSGNWVYVKEWYYYPFLHHFNNEKDAEKFYGKKLKEIKECSWGGSYIKTHIEPCYPMSDMYKVDENLYSVKEYADRHGKQQFIPNVCIA